MPAPSHRASRPLVWFAWWLAAIVAVMAIAREAPAQENHAQHHGVYQNWVNGLNQGCCNDNYCGTLPDDAERTHNGQLEVKIEGEWCPVLASHYLKRGNAPNGDATHVCVLPARDNVVASVCSRFICYQPKALY